jgi:hypothetical protein
MMMKPQEAALLLLDPGGNSAGILLAQSTALREVWGAYQ